MINLGFVMEQTLGHITHHQNLARYAAERPDICPTWIPIEVSQPDLWERLPVVSGNWSLKASLRARDAVRRARRARPLDAMFYHTQTTALFAVETMRQIPSVVSLDATPLNYDTVGEAYGHPRTAPGLLERRKFAWNQATFHAAAHLVTWCQWAKDSLISDYGIAARKITVIPPGIDMEKWKFGRERLSRPERSAGPHRLLFVGGDFERKGGLLLLKAFRNDLQERCELDIVTREVQVKALCSDIKGVRVHDNLSANSPELKALYAQADLFVFPTLGDCLPIAVMEAMAAGLPVISTGVGALREEVRHEVNGVIIPVRSAEAISDAVRSLCADPERLRAMSCAGRSLAEEHFDGRSNYGALLSLLKDVASGS